MSIVASVFYNAIVKLRKSEVILVLFFLRESTRTKDFEVRIFVVLFSVVYDITSIILGENRNCDRCDSVFFFFFFWKYLIHYRKLWIEMEDTTRHSTKKASSSTIYRGKRKEKQLFRRNNEIGGIRS